MKRRFIRWLLSLLPPLVVLGCGGKVAPVDPVTEYAAAACAIIERCPEGDRARLLAAWYPLEGGCLEVLTGVYRDVPDLECLEEHVAFLEGSECGDEPAPACRFWVAP